jgi:hypothetical protein
MPPTVSRGARRRYPRVPARWAVEAARSLGLRPMTVESYVHGRNPAHLFVAEAIRQARRWGDPAVLGKLMAPILDALNDGPPQSVDALLGPAQEADSAEEVAQTHYQRAQTRETRRALIEAERAQLATTAALIRALELEALTCSD